MSVASMNSLKKILSNWWCRKVVEFCWPMTNKNYIRIIWEKFTLKSMLPFPSLSNMRKIWSTKTCCKENIQYFTEEEKTLPLPPVVHHHDYQISPFPTNLDHHHANLRIARGQNEWVHLNDLLLVELPCGTVLLEAPANNKVQELFDFLDCFPPMEACSLSSLVYDMYS